MPSKLAARSNSSLNSLRVRLSLSQQKISGDTSRTSQLHQRRNNLSRETAIMGTTKNKRTRSKESEAVSRPTKRQATNASTTLNEAPTQKLDVYVFGSGESGELGLGHLKRNGKAPTNVKRPRLNDLLDAKTVGVVQLDVGGMHTVALTYDNRIVTWGVNDLGALGRDTTWVAPTKDANVDSESSDDDGDDSGLNPKESVPTAIPASLFPKGVKFCQVAASDSASFSLTVDGQVYGWGTFRGAEGVVGFTKEDSLTGNKIQKRPILISPLNHVKFIAAGGNHVQALDSKGNVYIWGTGGQFQLGREVIEKYLLNALIPTQFGLPRNKIKHIACGTYHNFAVDNKDRVYAWGLSNYGQTGIAKGAGEGNAVIRRPTIVKSLVGHKIKDIQGGNHHSIACTEDGSLLTWGRCDDAQAGIPIENIPKADLIFDDRGKPRILIKPTVVPNIPAVSIAAGIDNSIALTENGEVYSWGFSANYRTGQGTEEPIEEATIIDNSAINGKKMTLAGCGGQFSVLAGPTQEDE